MTVLGVLPAALEPPVLWAHLAATLYLVGLIWCVQVVHYPLMGAVGREHFPAYHSAHGARISLVVILPMVVELVTAFLLVGPVQTGAPAWMTWTGLGLVLVVWLSTFALQVPCHHKLEAGFDAAAHRRLVRTNWIRTIAWTLRGLLAIAITAAALDAPLW